MKHNKSKPRNPEVWLANMRAAAALRRHHRLCNWPGCETPVTRTPSGQMNKRCAIHVDNRSSAPPPPCGWEGCTRPSVPGTWRKCKRCAEHYGRKIGGIVWRSSIESTVCAHLEARSIPYHHGGFIPGIKHPYDILLIEHRIAIEVDGCRWHCCPIHPAQWADMDRKAVGRRRARDKNVVRWGSGRGWLVLRIWEHDVHVSRWLDEFMELVVSHCKERQPKH